MKIKQLVIFTIILNYVFENIYAILKTGLYDHNKKKLFFNVNTNTNN